MKLRSLQLEGVGSFADHAEIDFEGLANAGLFLIEGPTGSGKSTILDAIVFALYGSVAGADSDLGRLDSHLRTTSPWVELEFEVSGTVYRVRRSPAHTRVKKRGSGRTSVNATASLMQMTADGPVALATRASEVAEQIQRIVGLSKQQFVSTVVLAQGEFANFLDAGTQERAQILERVFGTEFYKQVEDQLQSMRKQAHKQRADAADAADDTLEQCKGVLDLELDATEPLVALDRALDAIRAELIEAEVRCGQLNLESRESRDALEAAKSFVVAQSRKRDALARRDEMERLAPEIRQLREAVESHRRASPVVPAIASWRRAQADADAATVESARCRRDLQALGEEATADADRLNEVVGLLAELGPVVEIEQGLESASSEVERLRAAAAVAAESVALTQQRMADVEQNLQQVGEELNSIPDTTDEMPALTSALEQWETRRSACKLLEVRRAELQAALRHADDADALSLAVDARLARAQEQILAGQAAALAATLVDGRPCAGCGSLEHPAPAVDPDAGDPATVEALREEVLQRREEAGRRRGDAQRLRGIVEQLVEQAGDTPPEEVQTGLDAARTALDRARAEQDRRRHAVERLRELEESRRSIAEGLTAAKLAEGVERTAFAKAAEALESARVRVSSARGEYSSVAQRVGVLTSIQEAQRSAARASAVEDTCRAARRQAEEVVDETLARVGLPSVEDAESALLDESRLDEIQRRIDLWQSAHESTRRELAELDAVDLTAVVDVEAMTALHAAADARAAEALRRVERLTDRLGRAEPRREALRERLETLQRVREITEPVIRMADLATAQRNEVIHRVRLSSFVLMRRFEDVVRAANDRLDAISEGRYQLSVEGQGLDGRAQAGLDLRIYDCRSDSKRSTRSLSGGERFYVSLALALGLADVVRSESGGMELGTLFIDEGFGSLDADVLEEVMDMLEQVRVGEDRVIGVISHVEILKSRIDARISVRRDNSRPGVSTLEVRV
jgi:exonuclease SbcC